MRGKRLDALILEKGMAISREKAKRLILAGRVYVNGQRVDKPGFLVDADDDIRVLLEDTEYVSRGGYKLKGAIERFNLDFKHKVVLDVGASTGGFTDCALKNGALKVYAVDVGYGQLDWRLRNDERVLVYERTNIRHVTPEMFPEKMDIALIDVSFISLGLVFPAVYPLLKEKGEVISLVKPQFEAGKDKVGKKGVVKDPQVHVEVLKAVADKARKTGFCPIDVCYSPLKGPEGNIEFFMRSIKGSAEGIKSNRLAEVVAEAHERLRG